MVGIGYFTSDSATLVATHYLRTPILTHAYAAPSSTDVNFW